MRENILLMMQTANSTFRWLAFVATLIGTYILTTTNTEYQWIGWFISFLSTSMWVYCAYKDGDIPRCTMEACFMFKRYYFLVWLKNQNGE